MKPQIIFKSVLSRYKDIKKRNAAFDALSDEDKRLEIAWDALQLVIKGGIQASPVHYWDYTISSKLRGILTNSELQEKLNTISLEDCAVCQRGLIMISQIRLGNSISPSDFNKDCGDEINLKGFSMKSMIAMEGEFESNYYDHPYKTNTREKLANICCNVLVNGDFNPADKTDYLKL